MLTKNLFLFLMILLVSCSDHETNQHKYVIDNEKILEEYQKRQINELFSQHEKVTNNEILLVTTDNYEKAKNIQEFASAFGNLHGVGKKGKDNGIVIAFNKKLQEIYISTGFGTEKVLKNEYIQKIIDSLMVPHFKKGNYYDGLYMGSYAIINFLEKPRNEIK